MDVQRGRACGRQVPSGKLQEGPTAWLRTGVPGPHGDVQLSRRPHLLRGHGSGGRWQARPQEGERPSRTTASPWASNPFVQFFRHASHGAQLKTTRQLDYNSKETKCRRHL